METEHKLFLQKRKTCDITMLALNVLNQVEYVTVHTMAFIYCHIHCLYRYATIACPQSAGKYRMLFSDHSLLTYQHDGATPHVTNK